MPCASSEWSAQVRQPDAIASARPFIVRFQLPLAPMKKPFGASHVTPSDVTSGFFRSVDCGTDEPSTPISPAGAVIVLLA